MSKRYSYSDWYLRELNHEEMRNVRNGFYGYGLHVELSLEQSQESNLGLVIRKAGLELAEGLLYLGFLFPYGSERKNALEPDYIEEDDDDFLDDEDEESSTPRISLDEDFDD